MTTLAPTVTSWRSKVPLRTERLLLREPTFDDVPAIAQTAGDPRVARMLTPIPLPFDESHAAAFVGDILASNRADGGLGIVVARAKMPQRAIGLASFAGEGDCAEIGWWFAPSVWGKGFATEAIDALIGIAFALPRLQRLTAGAFADNPASLRVHVKLGFSTDRVREKFSVARNSASPHVDMSLTRDAYLARLRTM